MTTRLMPDLSDFVCEREVIVWPTPDHVADSQGRIQFTAFWPAPSCVFGIRGQVFNACLDDFIAREQASGYLVTVTSDSEVPHV